jgi:hypothetical protein
MNATERYVVTAPKTPKAAPSVVARCATLTDARRAAKAYGADRPDLRHQDVRIDSASTDCLVEYAGPCR